MRLAEFIDKEMESILAEWEAFARTLLPASGGLDIAALRDHAEQILRTAARDLRSHQSPSDQAAKSRGEDSRPRPEAETAAETHGLLRATSGFTLRQLVAEYRALRATVLRLWADQEGHGSNPHMLVDMTRFNEAIDQAVAESVDFFALETDRWRNVFLGVVGHDLRGPLNAILLTSQLLTRLESEPVNKLAARLINGGQRMKLLLDDLLDYSRVSLDLGIPVSPTVADLAIACEEEVDLQRAVWPAHTIELVTSGITDGLWDSARLKQVVSNLISNAAKYGDQGAPIVVRLSGDDEHVAISVENSGPTISADEIETVFDPLRRAAQVEGDNERASLGLGLFIVREIVQAHGGTVAVSSNAGRTVFSLTLPRRPCLDPSGAIKDF